MKIILLKDDKNLGKKGNIANASDGYARNFLIPKGIAMEANEGNIKQIEHFKANEANKKEREKGQAQIFKEKLEKLTITIKTKTGDNRKLFGAITNKDIAEELKKQFNIDIDKKKISVDIIKTVGEHIVDVKIYPEISAKLKVLVEAE